MRILHLGKYYPPYAGGMETYLGDLLPALRKQGVEAQALVHATGARGDATSPVWRAPSVGRVLYTPISPAYPIWLRRLLAEFRPHLLHIHTPNPSACWVLLSPRAGQIPWLLQWHADIDFSANTELSLAYRAYAPMERRMLSKCVTIVTTSARYRESSTTLASWQEKTSIVPLGRDPRAVQAPSPDDLTFAQAAWGGRRTRVLAVGRMSFYKGFNFLLRASLDVPNVHCIVAGPNTDTALAPLAQELGIGDRVTLTGYQPQGRINALLQTCHCLCLPSTSRAEAFGVVLLEAMIHGKPVIASDIYGSGIGEVVEDGINGRLFSPGDAKHLAVRLADLVAHPDVWARMGSAGRKRFALRFHIDRSARAMAALYQIVLDER